MNLLTMLYSLQSIDLVFLIIFLVLFLIFIVYLVMNKVANKKAKKIIDEEITKAKEANSSVSTVVNKETVNSKEKLTEEVKEEVKEVVKPVKNEPIVETNLEEANEVLVASNVQETTEVLEETKVEEGRQYNGKYEVYKDGEFFRYRLKASNGEILLESEIYSTYKTCLASIDSLKRSLENGKSVIIKDKKKFFKFKLLAANHRVLAISANYPTEARAQSALDSTKRFALTNEIVDIELPADDIDSTLVLIEKVKEEAKKGGKFIIKKDVNGEFTWEMKPNNAEILCQSGGYCTKNGVESSIVAFKQVVETGKFYIYTDKNNKYQFKLYSQSGRLTMVGESYDTPQAVKSVVTSILNFIDLAVIQDKSVVAKKVVKPTK